MNSDLTTREIEQAVRALILARKVDAGFEVTVPVVYPTGENATVVVEYGESISMLHDVGNGAMCLTSEGIALSRQIRRRISALVEHYGCTFADGRVTRAVPNDHLALGIAVVANASRSVADIALESRRQFERDFSEAVTITLREIVGSRLRTREGVKGKSGREYRVENVILDRHEKHRVAFIESIRTRSVVADRFMEFHDLSQIHTNVDCFSVTTGNDYLTDPDEILLREVSRIVPYSESKLHFAELSTADT